MKMKEKPVGIIVLNIFSSLNDMACRKRGRLGLESVPCITLKRSLVQVNRIIIYLGFFFTDLIFILWYPIIGS